MPSTVTLNGWIAETRDHLEGSRSEEANILASAYVAASGTMVMTYELGNIAAGAYISVGANTLLVVSVVTATKTATVIAAQRGSTDAAATSGSMVRVNPRFTDHQIVRELNRHLASLSSPRNGLFAVATLELAYASTVESYNLAATGLVRVLEVRRQTAGVSLAWPRIRNDMWNVDLSASSAVFGAGMSIRVRGAESGYKVQVVYAKTFTPIAAAGGTLVSTTGVSEEQEDIPPLGAAVRLMTGREVARNDTSAQGDTRRANEVPPGAVAASYRGLAGLWQSRVSEESARLRAQYPYSK